MVGRGKASLINHVVKVWRRLERIEGITPADAYLSPIHLLEAIENALIDLKRMIEFHQPPGEMPDHHKYSGFISKWIAKTRPIQFPSSAGLSLRMKFMLGINARFAFFVMDSFLEYRTPIVIAQHMMYWFSFRDERGETLAMMAFCAEEIAKTSAAPAA